MGHKFLGVKPGVLEKGERCEICLKQFKEDDEIKKFQGEYYHKKCYAREMKKPLHKRFKRK